MKLYYKMSREFFFLLFYIAPQENLGALRDKVLGMFDKVLQERSLSYAGIWSSLHWTVEKQVLEDLTRIC